MLIPSTSSFSSAASITLLNSAMKPTCLISAAATEPTPTNAADPTARDSTFLYPAILTMATLSQAGSAAEVP